MRLIDYDAAIGRYYSEWDKRDICDGAQDRDWLKQCIDDAPTIDPKDLQLHGRWERVIPSKSAAKWCRSVSCSVCHTEGYKRYNYCPNCVAKMDEEARQ